MCEVSNLSHSSLFYNFVAVLHIIIRVLASLFAGVLPASRQRALFVVFAVAYQPIKLLDINFNVGIGHLIFIIVDN